MNRSIRAAGVRSLIVGSALAALAAAVPSTRANAQAITPTGTFGSQPTFTFGGSGIPNGAVMTNRNASTLGLLLGLSATQRYDNPALTNDGAGTFFADPGIDAHAPSPGDPYALWDFDFYLGGENSANYTYSLFYDFDPAVGNTQLQEGTFDLLTATASSPTQNSWNLGMNFLEIALLKAPDYATFDPSANGEYTFALVAYDNTTGAEAARSAIAVDVGDVNVVPEPASMSLLAVGLVGLAGMRRRRRKTSAA